MKARIGNKTYDTTKCANICRISGTSRFLCMKKSRREFYIYDKNASNKYDMFQDVPYDEAKEIAAMYASAEDYKYAFPKNAGSTRVKDSGAFIQFSQHDRDRIKALAAENRMSMSKFLLMLVDEYENSKRR